MTTINTNTSATTAFIVTPDTDGTFVVNTGSGVGAERMRVDASGNVGVGTNSPEYRLDVAATDNVTTTIAMSVQNSARNYGLGIGAYTMSNRNIGGTATTIDYTFDVGGDAIFKTANTEQMRLASSGDLKFNSGYGSVATAYGCRAWVNFNGQGTVAIRDSGNVSTVTDLGTGVYRVNFTTAMPDADYATCVTVSNDTAQTAPRTGGVNFGTNGGAPTTALVYVITGVSGSTANDLPYVNVTVFR